MILESMDSKAYLFIFPCRISSSLTNDQCTGSAITHTHTHTQTYIYIYIYMCVCVWLCGNTSFESTCYSVTDYLPIALYRSYGLNRRIRALWRHMRSWSLSKFVHVMTWCHQAPTIFWNNVDLSSVAPCAIHLKVISPEIRVTTTMHLKIPYLETSTSGAISPCCCVVFVSVYQYII